MADGRATLSAWIEQLRDLPAELVRSSMPDVVSATRADIAAHVDAGQAPDGTAWAPKQDGGRPLVGAADDVDVSAVGSVLLIKLSGKFVRHHKATARGGIRRQVIPTRKVPDALARVIGKIYSKRFAELTGGP